MKFLIGALRPKHSLLGTLGIFCHPLCLCVISDKGKITNHVIEIYIFLDKLDLPVL